VAEAISAFRQMEVGWGWAASSGAQMKAGWGWHCFCRFRDEGGLRQVR